MQQSPIICVNASKSIERWRRGGREGLPPIFLGGRGMTIFLYGGALCAIAKTTRASRSGLSSTPRFTCRDTGRIAYFFMSLSPTRQIARCHTIYVFEIHALSKISVPNVYPFKIYIGCICIGIAGNRETRKKRGCAVYLWKMTRKEYLIFPPFLSCRVENCFSNCN